MEYSDFDLKRVLIDFSLVTSEATDLFADVPPVEPGEHLRWWLDQYARLAVGVGSEKARSEYLITPIFAEARRLAQNTFNVLPGVTFEVDKGRGLSGVCDYLVSGSPELYFVRAPLLAVVEGKREDLVGGFGQCAAEMVAIRLFNEKEQAPRPCVYGCVTTGMVWQFLKLEGNTLFIDTAEYHLRELPKILGILVGIANG
ncbi:hypothetical protein [Gemmata sp.]|uniref:hypothetical protein n=1 Tax=Gemmata sp. TaxID=1914242 RepID=UPI003F725E8D